MTQSMTAFARAQEACDGINWCWEIRSVNHRYLDVSFRMPEAWRFLETKLRAVIRDKIFRGKLECHLKSQGAFSNEQALNINMGLIDSLLETAQTLAVSKARQNDLTITSLLSWPGVVEMVQPEMDQFSDVVVSLFEKALKQLKCARAEEGNALQSHISQRLERLQEEIGKAKIQIASNSLETRDKLLARVHSMQLTVDNSRVEQEIALLVARADVSEELDRLTTHTQEVAKILKGSLPEGRRLDFLMQELNREANTLSAKSDSIALTQIAVEMKVLIEQMREQIQNIE